MKQNMFYPIYTQLEKEFTELSYYMAIDKHQLSVYSIKISDLILRSVSECENLAKELCKKEGIKFYDKKHYVRKIVYFEEFIDRLESRYQLSTKLVDFIYENQNENTFDEKLAPFRKDKKITINKKSKIIWSWYNAYNKIKHDRIKYYK